MPLTRFAVKLTLLPALIFAALIGLIRSQPYDDSQLRAFLTPPDGCPAPCFMGIRPGVTTADEAIAILENHHWVGNITINRNHAQHIRSIEWRWSGQKPSLLRDGAFLVIDADQMLVRSIDIPTYLPLASVMTSAANPEKYYLFGERITYVQPFLAYTFDYVPENYFHIIGFAFCPYQSTIWWSDVDIVLSKREFIANRYENYPALQPFVQRLSYLETVDC